jgi:putative hydrolase
MTPLEALDRVVYLLDRTLAPSPKVRAFVRAGEIVRDLPPGELDERIAAGTLQELEGIGPSTASVIIDAHAGIEPARLARLEEETVLPLGDGAPYREALRGDCHLHSTWSDGGASIERMARTAMELGHEYMVLTDHSARLTIAHGLNRERLLAQFEEIDALNAELAPFRILKGMEVDIFEDGSLDLDEDLLERLDVVVGSVHSKFRMPPEQMTRRLVLALASPHIDILGHMTNRKVQGGKRPGSDFDANIVFAAAARFDKAIEINCRPERQDPPIELLDLALEWDCKIAIDTDAHAPGQLEWQVYGCDKAAQCGVPIESVVNTWAADELVAWADTHPTD